MKLTTRQDIEAPLAFVHETLTDFDGWERAAMRRGADVSRTDTLSRPGVGMAWQSRFKLRGKERDIQLMLSDWEAPLRLGFSGGSATIGSDAVLELIEMSTNRTRLQVNLEVMAKSMGARLLLQSMRLARGRIDRSFDQRMAQMAAEIENRYRANQRR